MNSILVRDLHSLNTRGDGGSWGGVIIWNSAIFSRGTNQNLQYLFTFPLLCNVLLKYFSTPISKSKQSKGGKRQQSDTYIFACSTFLGLKDGTKIMQKVTLENAIRPFIIRTAEGRNPSSPMSLLPS